MAYHVMDEANRCLNCKNPQCVKGCPVNIQIPDFIKALKEENIKPDLFWFNPNIHPYTEYKNINIGYITKLLKETSLK